MEEKRDACFVSTRNANITVHDVDNVVSLLCWDKCNISNMLQIFLLVFVFVLLFLAIIPRYNGVLLHIFGCMQNTVLRYFMAVKTSVALCNQLFQVEFSWCMPY